MKQRDRSSVNGKGTEQCGEEGREGAEAHMKIIKVCYVQVL